MAALITVFTVSVNKVSIRAVCFSRYRLPASSMWWWTPAHVRPLWLMKHSDNQWQFPSRFLSRWSAKHTVFWGGFNSHPRGRSTCRVDVMLLQFRSGGGKEPRNLLVKVKVVATSHQESEISTKRLLFRRKYKINEVTWYFIDVLTSAKRIHMQI